MIHFLTTAVVLAIVFLPFISMFSWANDYCANNHDANSFLGNLKGLLILSAIAAGYIAIGTAVLTLLGL